MENFDHRRLPPIPAELTVVPTHGESWAKKWPNWWCGATIASPTRAMTVPAAEAVKRLRERANDPVALSAYMSQEADLAREWIRKVLQVPDEEPVILDASGTAAILTASRILSHLAEPAGEFWTLTTDEGGSLVPAALKGRNPNEFEKVMFQPVTSLFYDPSSPVLSYPNGMRVNSLRMLHVADHSNADLLQRIRDAAHAAVGPGCIMLPHVTKTGRILPIREVGQLVAELRAQGRQVFLVIDDIQGISRVAPEAVANPTSFCDAYVFGSSKALGGILIASGIVMRKELLDAFVEKASRAGVIAQPCIAHFQFSPSWQDRLGGGILKQSAISIPEVASMRAGLYELYIRGSRPAIDVGVDTYEQRRAACLARIQDKRKELVAGLAAISGMQILESTPERPVVPSIVCFRLERDDWRCGQVKDQLQENDPIITPSAPIGRYIRLDIPEYRPMPSVEVLVTALGQLLG